MGLAASLNSSQLGLSNRYTIETLVASSEGLQVKIQPNKTRFGMILMVLFKSVLQVQIARGLDHLRARPVAILTYKCFKIKSGQPARLLLRNIHFLRNLSHPSIMRILSVAVSAEGVTLIVDYCDLDLAMLLSSPQHLSEQHCKYIMRQLAELIV
jgi:serine/threonine protein kinase